MAERLIDAEAFLKTEIDRCGGAPLVGTCTSDNEYLSDRLKNAPTIEAKPVVHAHWEEHREFYEDEGFEGYYYSCSNCGGTLYGDVEGFNFCHCCGAQMDEFASDNNVGSKGVKIPVISMEDVPKIMEEKE